MKNINFSLNKPTYILIIVGIVLLSAFFYPKDGGYRQYDKKGGFKEQTCTCIGISSRFSFFSSSKFTCFGIPIQCSYNEQETISTINNMKKTDFFTLMTQIFRLIFCGVIFSGVYAFVSFFI